MKTAELTALRQRLADGTFTDADTELGQQIVKSLQAGTFAIEDEQPTPAASQATTEPVEIPEPTEVRKSLEAQPETNRAINAVPVLQEIVGGMEGILKSLQGIAARQAAQDDQLASLQGQLSGLQKSLEGLTLPDSPGDKLAIEKSLIGQDTQRAIDAALTAFGFQDRLAQVETAVHQRPFSPHPAVRTEMRKSLGGRELTKGEAIAVLRKSLDGGVIDDTRFSNAMSALDMHQHLGKSFTDIVLQTDPQALA